MSECEVIDALFAEKAKSGMVRESKSPHSTPTFCVRKPNGKWRLVHAYNKLNNATVPAQTPIPRKDVLLNNMSGCTLYSALDLIDGYYQILMRESDIPLTAVSTPSGMLWEWLAMPQGLSNTPATFNRLVTQLFRPLLGQEAIAVHLKLLRREFEVMRANKLYANIDKEGQRHSSLADPEITEGPPEDAHGVCEKQHEDAFDSIKASLQEAPVLALPDENKSFSLVCDASDYAIGCALLQKDSEGREHVIPFQSRQLKAAQRNYPYISWDQRPSRSTLITRPCGPPPTRRICRSEWRAVILRGVELPRRIQAGQAQRACRCIVDYELAQVSQVTTDLYDRIRLANQADENCTPLLRFLFDGKDANVDRLLPRQRAQLHRYELGDGPWRSSSGIVVPKDEDLKYDILLEEFDAPMRGNLGREKTYETVSQTFWWPRMYKWVHNMSRHRVKHSGHASAPLQILPVPTYR
ncbi:LOW QUALITY PROTEIN: Reverse transcriptase [Phytophthora palmivora]|uniref:Reverse transcriptase n=1 Tax=Phytophthora palmivora TaxID=4796 RepID=A0A2P4XG68_9STRA|nr:LOW QUALITY PROTEIN: Reverse transcriptase [Phytophthora palmivora]